LNEGSVFLTAKLTAEDLPSKIAAVDRIISQGRYEV